MPANARDFLIPNGADWLVHTLFRDLRRPWFCGDDAYSGKKLERRRELEKTSGRFARPCPIGDEFLIRHTR